MDNLTILQQAIEKIEALERENKELKNDIWNWECKYKLLHETYQEFLSIVNNLKAK